MTQRIRSIPACVLLALSVLCAGSTAHATQHSRIALVIGNAAYDEAPLRNPVNDARAVSRALENLDFEVTTVTDATKREMELAVVAFTERLAGGGTGLFYYAGHGIQVRGRNYLLPVDAGIESESMARVEGIDVGFVLEELTHADNPLNIVILDACRNNPFERRMRGGSRGLAAIDAAQGVLIAYATAPGSVAADGDGENGLYTQELLKALARPGLSAEQVFKQVRIGVSEHSGGLQIPWESSSLTGELIFNRASGRVGRSAEAIFWDSIKSSDDASDFRAYLEQYPDGIFAPLARSRLEAAPTEPQPDTPRDVNRVDQVPLVGDKGRMLYEKKFLGASYPRAFAVSTGGAVGWSTSSSPETAVLACQGRTRATCHLYAVDGKVVWSEELLWQAIESSDFFADYRKYLKYFPSGAHAAQARERHQRLMREAANAPVPALKHASRVPYLLMNGRKEYVRFLYRNNPRAFAIASSGAFGWRVGEDAAARALEACQKLTQARCEIYARDDTLVWSVDRDAALFADEGTDWGVPESNRIRSEDLYAPTPTTAPGAETISTRQLLARLAQPQPPLLIDVRSAGRPKSLPRSLWLKGAGEPGPGENETDAWLAGQLAELTQRNPEREIVLFARNAYSWHAYNAVLRAKRLGYKNVKWYRGGIAAWEAAGYLREVGSVIAQSAPN